MHDAVSDAVVAFSRGCYMNFHKLLDIRKFFCMPLRISVIGRVSFRAQAIFEFISCQVFGSPHQNNTINCIVLVNLR